MAEAVQAARAARSQRDELRSINDDALARVREMRARAAHTARRSDDSLALERRLAGAEATLADERRRGRDRIHELERRLAASEAERAQANAGWREADSARQRTEQRLAQETERREELQAGLTTANERLRAQTIEQQAAASMNGLDQDLRRAEERAESAEGFLEATREELRCEIDRAAAAEASVAAVEPELTKLRRENRELEEELRKQQSVSNGLSDELLIGRNALQEAVAAVEHAEAAAATSAAKETAANQLSFKLLDAAGDDRVRIDALSEELAEVTSRCAAATKDAQEAESRCAAATAAHEEASSLNAVLAARNIELEGQCLATKARVAMPPALLRMICEAPCHSNRSKAHRISSF